MKTIKQNLVIKKLFASLYFLRTAVLALVFGISIPLAFSAALCVTNPAQGLCPLTVLVTPSAYTLPYGGNTNVAFTIGGILEWNVSVLSASTWMVEDNTGTNTNLAITGTWPAYGGTRTANTGPLTRSVMVHACVENTQATISCNSSYISLPSCYVENILDLGAGPQVMGTKVLFIGDPAYSVRSYLPKYNYTCTGNAGGNCVRGSIDAIGNTSVTCSQTPQAPAVNIYFN